MFTVADGPHFSPQYVEKNEGVPFLSTRNISSSNIDMESAKYVSHEDHEEFCKRVKVKKVMFYIRKVAQQELPK